MNSSVPIAILMAAVLLAGCVTECGDGICEPPESAQNCPQDCSPNATAPNKTSAPNLTAPSQIGAANLTLEPAQPQSPVNATIIPPAAISTLQLEPYSSKEFSLQKPVGWQVTKAGDCETLAIIVSDPANPANTAFYFNELGPMYSSQGQVQVDQAYMAIGGYQILWHDAPVLNPATPIKFLEIYPELTQMELAEAFTDAWPQLDGIEAVSTRTESTALTGASAETVRALFRAGDGVGEGMFYVAVAEVLPGVGAPGAGISYAFSFTGITSEKDDFDCYEPALLRSLGTISFSDEYVGACLKSQQSQLKASLDISKALSQTSDAIMDSWNSRQESDDILSEKRSDAMLDRARVYDPDTGNVFEVENGFFDDYDLHRSNYEMSGLQALPSSDHELWVSPTLNGQEHIR